MLSYDSDDESLIASCSFDNVDLNTVDPQEIFPVGSRWRDRSLLYSTVQAYAAATGWKASLSHSFYIRCSCYDRPLRKNKTRTFSSGSLSKNCKWEIKIRSTKNDVRRIKSGISEGKFKSYAVIKDGVNIIISKANLEHTGECNPSTLQQVMQRSRSGAYVRGISDTSLYTLCTMLKDEGKLSSSFIKQILRSQFPANKNVNNRHVYWMKQRIKRILPRMHECGNFKDFQNMFKTTRLHNGIDDIPLTKDNIAQMGKELWIEIMNDDNCQDSIITFQEYMLNLQENNKGFAVTLLKSAETGRLTGCIWQTAIMRDNFERFGGYLSMDAMLRPINEMEWPYMSISMYNELNSVCVACEGIVCGERLEAYKAMIDFVIENNTKRNRSDIDVVASDGILDQEKVTNCLQLPNAIFMADVYHLLDSVLPKKFGLDCYNLLQSNIKQMIYSNTKQGFEDNFKKGMELLQNRDHRNVKHESLLQEFESQKESYATYILSKKKGTRGKHGSSISEMNHSSILAHLNDGLKNGNHYSEKPHTLVKDLFIRQENHIVKWNQLIYNENNDLSVLRSSINKDSDPHLYHASEVLCLRSFRDFKERMENASYYSKQITSQTCVTIRSLKHPSAPPRDCFRKDVNGYFTCNTCSSSIAREEQCVHSIVANEKVFVPDQFARHHFRRQFVSGSYISMDPTENQQYDDVDSDTELNNSTISDDESPDEDRMADNDIADDSMDAAHFEQLPSGKTDVKCLSVNELKNLTDQILGKYDSCNNKVKKKINAVMLSLNEICLTDGAVNGIFDNDVDSNYENMNIEERIDGMIKDHKDTFLPSKNNFINNDNICNKILRPSASQFRKHNKLRLMTNRHKYQRKVKKYSNNRNISMTFAKGMSKKKSSCKFCGSTEPGERISSCKKRAELQGLSQEYILGSNHNGLQNFVQKMEYNTTFERQIPFPTNAIKIGENSKSQHFFIHTVWSPFDETVSKVSFDSLVIEFSYITKFGSVDSVKKQILGKALYAMLAACDLRNGPFFVYDKTAYKENSNNVDHNITFINRSIRPVIPNGFIENITPFTQPQSLSQGSYFTPMSQEFFGNTNFGYNLYNMGNHNGMQQLNQVTNNYMFNKKDSHNDIEEDMNVVDL